MLEYAILIVMVIFAIGFAWLWFIEQKKSEREEKRFSKRRSSDSAQAVDHAGRAGTRGRCT
jgi:hypothetical protein